MQDAKMQHQKILELMYSKNQLLPRIRAEFLECKEFDFSKYIESTGLPVEFGIELLTQMALHKRCNLPTLIGCLRYLAEDAQQCADYLYQAAVSDLINWSPDLQMFVVIFTISYDVQEELDRFQYPLPMVIPPKELKSNTDCGYLTSRGSVILRNNHHSDDICLDHLNRMNQIALTINHDVVKMVKNKWRNLDKPKEGEKREDYERRRRAFEKYDRSAKDVISIIQKEGNDFYLTHKYDKRGRTYCQGYHVNYQGAPWNKAVIEFSNQEVTQ